MRYPPFIAVLANESNRPRLLTGVWSGYAIVAAMTLLAIAAQVQRLVPFGWTFYVLIGVKLASNSVALVGLKTRRAVLETSGFNVFVDLVVETGAIYYTGGPLSPLFALYVIEIAVLAMLTNVGTTVLTAAGALWLYVSMVLAEYVGVLPPVAPPISSPSQLTIPYLLTAIALAVFLLGALTFYVIVMLRLMREKESALAEKAAELVEAAKTKGQFVANITHELRTPIHGVLGLADLIESGIYGAVTEKQKNALAGIRTSGEHLLELIDDLLQLARAEAGKLDFRPSSVDVRELLDAVAATTRAMIGAKTMSFDARVEDGVASVFTDRAKLVQILVNLLANAVKFTPDGGSIELRIAPKDGGAVFEVRDTGIGIPETELPRIFDEFRQVDGSASRSFGGAGLGLALVKRLCDVIGATVSVVSTVGTGSIFIVSLPPVRAPDATARFNAVDRGGGEQEVTKV